MYGIRVPLLQILSPAQYSPAAQALLQKPFPSLLQVLSPVLGDSLHTVLLLLVEQSDEIMQETEILF